MIAIKPAIIRRVLCAVRLCVIAAVCAALPPQAKAREAVTYLLPAGATQPAFAPWILAKQLGYYADAGYDVSFQTAGGGVDVARQIDAGTVDIGGGLGDTPVIVRGQGVKVKAIAVLGGGSLTVIVAGAGRGIQTMRDLRGKHLMVLSFADTTYHVLLGALAGAGLRKNDLDIEAATPETIVRRVASGAADACACVPDWQVEISNAQPGSTIIPTDDIPDMAQAILASDRAIAAKPDMLRALVGATLRGMRFITADPAKAADAYVQAVPRWEGKQALLTQVFHAYIDLAYRGQPVPGRIDVARLDALQAFYLQHGFIKKAVPVADLYANTFVPAATP